MKKKITKRERKKPQEKPSAVHCRCSPPAACSQLPRSSGLGWLPLSPWLRTPRVPGRRPCSLLAAGCSSRRVAQGRPQSLWLRIHSFATCQTAGVFSALPSPYTRSAAPSEEVSSVPAERRPGPAPSPQQTRQAPLLAARRWLIEPSSAPRCGCPRPAPSGGQAPRVRRAGPTGPTVPPQGGTSLPGALQPRRRRCGPRTALCPEGSAALGACR